MNDATADPTLRVARSVKHRLAKGDLVGPRLLANGPAVDGDPPLTSNPVVVRTAAEARAIVDTLADHGADFVKVYTNLSREAYFAIIDQARKRGIPVDGHVPFRVLPAEAADSGQRTFEHLLAMALGCSTDVNSERKEFARILSDPSRSAVIERSPLERFRHERRLYDSRDPAACTGTIEAYRRNDVAEAPSIVGYHHVVNAKEILSDAENLRLVPPAVRRNWEERLDSETGRTVRSILAPLVHLQVENTRLLHKAGVVLLAATDVGIPMLVPGVSLHEELALLVEAGLTPLEALRTATVNPARVLGMADSLGTIEAGKLADLVLLDANPLADIANTRPIRAVVADGRLYRRADLDRLRAGVETLNQQIENRR
jgi:Amidohydrolase family